MFELIIELNVENLVEIQELLIVEVKHEHDQIEYNNDLKHNVSKPHSWKYYQVEITAPKQTKASTGSSTQQLKQLNKLFVIPLFLTHKICQT